MNDRGDGPECVRVSEGPFEALFDGLVDEPVGGVTLERVFAGSRFPDTSIAEMRVVFGREGDGS